MADNWTWYGCTRPRRTSANNWVVCRDCEGCRKKKRYLWTARARCEMASAPRTWFATLTYAGGEQNAQYSRIQNWLKRVRKRGGNLRYVCPSEIGGDGRLHWHLLLHGTSDLTYRSLRDQWRVSDGISEFTLCQSASAAGYANKAAGYASKQTLRVRASVAYGSAGFRRFVNGNEWTSGGRTRDDGEKTDTVALGDLVSSALRAFPDASVDTYRIDGLPISKRVMRSDPVDAEPPKPKHLPSGVIWDEVLAHKYDGLQYPLRPVGWTEQQSDDLEWQ